MTSDDADSRDFATFMRFFCTRMVQAVVQARMGKLRTTPCAPNSDQNWFNLVIDELGEIAAHLKSTIGRNYPPKVPALSLEFILNTADGDRLPLETWVIRLDRECQDWSVNVRTTLYQQMSTLLKSIIVASRFTPTYRYYVSNQGPETFIIMYLVYEGEPDLTVLGDEVKHRQLGYLPSPFGTLSVELHFRTKMEIQPQPFVEEGIVNTAVQAGKSREFPMGIAVPTETSQTIPLSPTSMENINLFSTSPSSQDLPFRAKSPNFGIGRSLSAVDAVDRSEGTKSADQQSSPPTSSSSFPQRNSAQRLRMRNNSFPFASLLLTSQSSSDQLKTLPNVPEDAALNTATTTLTESRSKQSLEDFKGTKEEEENDKELRRNSSIGIEMVAFSDESTSNRPGSSSQIDESRPNSKILFGCGPENREELSRQKETTSAQGNEKDDVDSSDDSSYVKVIAFAGGTDEELGTDLSEFFKEVRFAPDQLRSFEAETTTMDLQKQLDQFRQQEPSFSRFVTGLREREETEEEEEEEE